MSDQYEGAVTSLEQVFRSREFGTPRRPRSVLAAEVPLPSLRLEDAVVTVLPSVLRESNRHRAIAAASGIAAAALVVAGLATGSSQLRRGDISAQGSGTPGTRAGPRPLPGGASVSPIGLSPGGAGAAQAASSGASGASPAFLTGAPVHPAQSGPPRVIIEVPPGTTVTVVPSPIEPQSGPTGSGSGGSTGSPPLASPGSANATAPVVVVGNTVTTVGSAAPATANQVASSVTGVAPVTGARGGVGTAAAGLGQTLNSTTA